MHQCCVCDNAVVSIGVFFALVDSAVCASLCARVCDRVVRENALCVSNYVLTTRNEAVGASRMGNLADFAYLHL